MIATEHDFEFHTTDLPQKSFGEILVRLKERWPSISGTYTENKQGTLNHFDFVDGNIPVGETDTIQDILLFRDQEMWKDFDWDNSDLDDFDNEGVVFLHAPAFESWEYSCHVEELYDYVSKESIPDVDYYIVGKLYRFTLTLAADPANHTFSKWALDLIVDILTPKST